MRVYHYDTDTLLFLNQEEEVYFVKIEGDGTERIGSFSDLSSALWHMIEYIRSIALRTIKEREFKMVAKKINTDDQPSKDSLLKLLRGQKIHKVFYDTAFLSMLTHHNSKKKYDLILENKTNFFLYDEIAYIIKMHKKKVLEGSSF